MRKRKLLNVLYGGDMATGVVALVAPHPHCWLWNGGGYGARVISLGRIKNGNIASNTICVKQAYPHWKEQK